MIIINILTYPPLNQINIDLKNNKKMNNSDNLIDIINNPEFSAILANPSENSQIDIRYTEMIRYFLKEQFGQDNFKVYRYIL